MASTSEAFVIRKAEELRVKAERREIERCMVLKRCEEKDVVCLR